MPDRKHERLPVCIITGFLGSGKTTFLNKVLTDPALMRSLVVINEFGEMGLDHLLVTSPVENMLVLENGCLCCSSRGDLVGTLTDAHAQWQAGVVPPFDRVIVETSGLADPVAIMRTVVCDEKLSSHFLLDRVITLVDSINGEEQLDHFSESTKQAIVADYLILSKTDLAESAAVDLLRDHLHALNAGAEIIEAVRGETDMHRLFGTSAGGHRSQNVDRWLGGMVAPRDGGTLPGAYKTAVDHTSDVSTFSLYHDQPVRWPGLHLWLEMLARFKGIDLLRIKGLLNVEGRPVVIHAVQTIVHEPIVLDVWPDADRRSRLVFIVRNISQMEIEKTLDAFSYEVSPVMVGSELDPEAYAHFVRQAGLFN